MVCTADGVKNDHVRNNDCQNVMVLGWNEENVCPYELNP